MRRLIRVAFVLLSMMSVSAVATSAQGVGGRSSGQQDFELRQNFPNPFNPETTIPFALNEGLFREGGNAVVTIRIFNQLKQLVASPVALRHPAGEGASMIQLEYTRPGSFQAFWDGRDSSGRQVASGVYFCQITVNGRSQIMRMFVTK